MASSNKNSQSLATPQSRFLVTYSIGGLKSPKRLRVISLPKLLQYLVARHQEATEALHEPWQPLSGSPRSQSYQRWKQDELLQSTFPFVVVGSVYDKEADLADEEDDKSGWQDLSGLVMLTFKYRVVKGDAKRTAASRERLQKLLLDTPLLGPSIVAMWKELGACRLHVLVAAGVMPDYMRRVRTIIRYVLNACPKLNSKIFGEDLFADTRYPIGNDPQAWLRLRPAGGYTLFPVKQAQEATKEGELRQQELTRKRRETRNKKK